MSLKPFSNFPLTDFSIPTNRTFFEKEISELQTSIETTGGLYAAPLINGIEQTSTEEYVRFNPSNYSKIVGRSFFATTAHAQSALNACSEGFPAWRSTAFEHRADIINKIGRLLEARRGFFAALLILEAGKTFREADADVAEAIDFCNFYASEMLRLGPPTLTQELLGEENTYFYQPRGVVVVISPWNFPLAIACGMSVAALVAGNAVIFKPSEQTSIVGFELAKLILEAGVPHNIFAFLPGQGEVVGDYLVRAPETAMIVFTGSRSVGCSIIETSARIVEKQRGIKKVVAELGGKNAIIVDEDADLDDAVQGILASAFGYSGQKCSACSRLIVVGSMYEEILTRLSHATTDLRIGPAYEAETVVGPIVDEESYNRIQNLIQQHSGSQLLCQTTISEELARTGWYVPPTIFRDVDRTSTLWKDEIFGPVLCCLNVDTYDEALEIANDSEYALTGGVFSRSPAHIERAKQEFLVGNLYINRSITGALVQRQPFGGFKFSGVGSKAGGTDYLLQFMEPRTITENTMRKGHAPEIE